MKTLFSVPILMLGFLLPQTAWSQFPGMYNQAYGSGQYHTAAPCGYGMKVPREIRSMNEDIKEAREKLQELKDKKREMERDLDRMKSGMEDAIASTFLSASETQVTMAECKAGTGGSGVGSQTTAEQSSWTTYCQDGKPLHDSICTTQKDPVRTAQTNCKRALVFNNTTKKYKIHETATMIEEYDKRIETLDERLDRMEKNRDDEADDYLERIREGDTEAGHCSWCEEGDSRRSEGPGWKTALFTGALDVGMILGNYFTQRHAINKSADLGYAYYPYPTGGYGYPFLTAGLYGAAYGGIGGGGLGCAPTAGGAGFPGGPFGMAGPYGQWNPYGGGGGPFGYPGSIYGGLGGSLMLPGMGPWGMNCGQGFCGGPQGGMYGIGNFPGGFGVPGGMMGYPGGFAIGGQFGFAVGGQGFPGGGFQQGGFGVPGGMGFQQGGFGVPGGGFQQGGFGVPGGMGFPGGGFQQGGFGVPGGMGFPGGGFQQGGFGVPGGMGFPGGGFQQGGFGIPGGQGIPGGGFGMDYYNMMMQQQMMQYQMQLEYSRVYQQQYMQKYQVVMGLYQELTGLQMRLQQAMQSLYYGGGFSGGGGGGIGIGGGFQFGIGGGGGFGGVPGGMGPPGVFPGGPIVPPPGATTR